MMKIIVSSDQTQRVEPRQLLPPAIGRTLLDAIIDTDHDDDGLLLEHGFAALGDRLAPRRADVRQLVDRLGKTDIDQIVALGEGTQVVAAAVREMFGLSGPTLCDIRFFRDKLFMKRRLRSYGVATPDFVSVDDRDDAQRFARQYQDILLKPRTSYAGRGIVQMRDGGGAEAFDSAAGAMIEEFIEGPIYHADGIVNGMDIAQLTIAEYIHPPLQFLRGAPAGSMVCRDEAIRRNVAQFVTEMIACAPRMGSYAFHADIFHHACKGLLAGEIACRPGGNRIRSMLKASTGIDPAQANLRVQLGLPIRSLAFNDPIRGMAWGAVRKRRGTLTARLDLSSPPEGIFAPVFHGSIGAPMREAQGNSDLLLSFIVSGETREELLLRHAGGIAWAEEAVARVMT